jgi:hypothetical protein
MPRELCMLCLGRSRPARAGPGWGAQAIGRAAQLICVRLDAWMSAVAGIAPVGV